MGRLLPADKAWIALTGGVIFFELASEDLLSHASERMCRRHPVLTRLLIVALAGHLGCVLPHHVDMFDAKNLIHRGIVLGCRQIKNGMR